LDRRKSDTIARQRDPKKQKVARNAAVGEAGLSKEAKVFVPDASLPSLSSVHLPDL